MGEARGAARRSLGAPAVGALISGAAALVAFVVAWLAWRSTGRVGLEAASSAFVGLALALSARALGRAALRRELVLGLDGLVVGGVRGRVVPYAAIARCTRDGAGLRIALRDGSSLLLPQGVGEADREALFTEIAAALADVADEAPPASIGRLDRRGRAGSTWRDDLLRMAADDGDYRRARVAPELLAAALVDPAAPAGRRVAAALVLAAGGGADRVRIAARGCADDELAAALERAAEGEIDEAAIARVEARAACAGRVSEWTPVPRRGGV